MYWPSHLLELPKCDADLSGLNQFFFLILCSNKNKWVWLMIFIAWKHDGKFLCRNILFRSLDFAFNYFSQFKVRTHKIPLHSENFVMNFFRCARNASELFIYCVRVNRRRFIRKLQCDRAYEIPCPAAAKLVGKRKSGLVIALVFFLSSCFLIPVRYHQFLLQCSQELNRGMKNSFCDKKNARARLNLHLSRHVLLLQ